MTRMPLAAGVVKSSVRSRAVGTVADKAGSTLQGMSEITVAEKARRHCRILPWNHMRIRHHVLFDAKLLVRIDSVTGM